MAVSGFLTFGMKGIRKEERIMESLFLKRIFVFLAAIIIALTTVNISAMAVEEFPTRPIEFVVCWPPGGGADVAARIIMPAVEKLLGVSVYITNKAGGSGVVGVSYALNKKPDGYTLFGVHQFGTFLADVLGELPYDFNDIYPICNWIDNVNIWAILEKSPVKTFKELVEYAKKNPGKLKIGIPSTRASQGVGAEFLKYQAGLDIVSVPFGGSGPTLTSFLGGHCDLSSLPFPMVKPHVEAGKVRVLVILGKNRIEELPDVPLAEDLGYQAEPLGFAGAGIAAKVPKDRIEKISAAFDKVMKDPEVLGRLKKAGFMPTYMNHEEFVRHIKEGGEKVIKIKDKLK